jgi:hypothetical protein
MRNDQEFAHLEAHEEYPDGFQSKMKTQRKLVQNAVGQTHTFLQSSSTADIPKSNRYKPAKWAAAILIMFISGTIYLGWYQSQNTNKATQITASNKIKITEIQASAKRARNRTKRQAISTSTMPSNTEGSFAQFSLDTPIVSAPATTAVVTVTKAKLFEKSQRFKQFEFHPKKLQNQTKPKPAGTEFFVFRDGQFKFIAPPGEQQFLQITESK